MYIDEQVFNEHGVTYVLVSNFRDTRFIEVFRDGKANIHDLPDHRFCTDCEWREIRDILPWFINPLEN